MRPLRSLCLLVATALVATGCGMFADPVVSTEDEVLDALAALEGGVEARLTAELAVDEDEVRGALRDDAEARELLLREFGEDGDVDALLADLATVQEELAEHAVVLASGADGSARMAAAWRGVIWLDLRGGAERAVDGDLADGFDLDLQARVDWSTASDLFAQPDLLGDLDEAAAELAPFLGDLPDATGLERVLLGLLGGELVGISGPVGPDLLAGLGGLGAFSGGGALDAATLPGLDIDRRTLLATALTVDGFRRDGDDTIADVTVELRAAGDLVLEQIAEAPDAFGMTFDDVDEARTELRAMPEQLTDVATLRFDDDGVLRQVRTDVLDVVLQLARATAPDDEDLEVVERVAAELDATGLFVQLDVEGVGTTPTVLGQPAASVTPEELGAALGAAVFGGLGAGLGAFPGGLEGLPDGALPEDILPSEAPDDESTSTNDPATDEDTSEEPVAEPPASFGDETVRPDELTIGDCFDDDVLFGFAPADADATVPCADDHDNEAFALVETNAETYDEMTRNEGDAVRCIEQFEDYVGVTYAESELVVDVLRPSEAEFAAGARTSVCYLYGFERLVGSMAGTGR